MNSSAELKEAKVDSSGFSFAELIIDNEITMWVRVFFPLSHFLPMYKVN